MKPVTKFFAINLILMASEALSGLAIEIATASTLPVWTLATLMSVPLWAIIKILLSSSRKKTTIYR